jgi:putative ABC transport system ATP-binding protein
VAALRAARLDAAFLDRPADDLSGGEAQRMCVARTLLTRPRAVLFDEPTSSLDAASARAVEALATGLASAGTPVLWVTHELDQAQRLADHVMVVIDGRVAQAGDREAVLGHPTPAVRRFLAGGDA